MSKEKFNDYYEFDLMKIFIEERKNLFSLNPQINSNLFYEHYFSKGFSIEYKVEKIPKNFSVTKFKSKEGKLESLVLDDENKEIARIIINGNKPLENYFKNNKIIKEELFFEKENHKTKNIQMPKVYFGFNCIAEISKFIQMNKEDLILKNTYFKMNLDQPFDNYRKYELSLKTFNDPKGDYWSIFLINEKNMGLKNPLLKGYKQYSLN